MPLWIPWCPCWGSCASNPGSTTQPSQEKEIHADSTGGTEGLQRTSSKNKRKKVREWKKKGMSSEDHLSRWQPTERTLKIFPRGQWRSILRWWELRQWRWRLVHQCEGNLPCSLHSNHSTPHEAQHSKTSREKENKKEREQMKRKIGKEKKKKWREGKEKGMKRKIFLQK